ncbi:linear amide C-N hydrolase (plasmid) [Pseudoalteromonas xiamenensis]|uniref:linear amide C-N hydrolase n=1 Tax=Pseudoalteromonas xiamenensis TaxID=882626 RepID=UPI0027E3F564|nr:linear amide C-N hydrolase [Pseudoalteromonas xiamenensis]WMN61636.1 linear amide C-N hydrolase [Pseudoalteromonas xiamenensis]
MCTRVFNNINFQYLTTARNMDWMYVLPTSLFVFEKGLKKIGVSSTKPEERAKALKWQSSYSSVVAMVGDDCNGWASSDGMNEMGLVVNALYDTNASYDGVSSSGSAKQLSVLRWVQYVLDNFVFVKDVVKSFSAGDIQLIGDKVPHSQDKSATVHLSLSDATGNSAILEVYKGKFHIHESANYKVMTNEPNYDAQLKLDDYWQWQWSEENPHPSHTIPGGAFSTDRFERASFYINHVNAPESDSESIAQARTVAASASVPIGYNFTDTKSPNISNTLWTTVATHRSLKYFFQNSQTPNIVWVDLERFQFLTPSSKVDLITLNDQSNAVESPLQGEINNAFQTVCDPYKA